mgnify:CR=1 FL=1
MTEADVHSGNPVVGASIRSRIQQLDVLRGLAILGILFLNLPPMGTTILAAFEFPHLAPSWNPADQAAWRFLEVFVEGTQRGLLQFLFGASVLILTARAMRADGPVAVADLYYRRNLWLLVFGLVNIFVLLFPGDILFVYALAALFLFPFRRVGPKTLLALGLSWALLQAVVGGARYVERAQLAEEVATIRLDRSALGRSDKETLERWAEARKEVTPDREFLAADAANRVASLPRYAAWMQEMWLERARSLEIFFKAVPEAFAAMLIGMALFKWQVLQGMRRRRFYVVAGAAAYAIGLALRFVEAEQQLSLIPGPRLEWITEEFARLAVTFGHVCLVSLIFATSTGHRLLSFFSASGRMAFSLYVMQTILITWLLSPAFGLGLWGKLGWAEMLLVSVIIAAGQAVLAVLWLRPFATGPVEWLWRSLVDMKPRPFRL